MVVGRGASGGAVGGLVLRVRGLYEAAASTGIGQLSAVSVLRIFAVDVVSGYGDPVRRFDGGEREPDHENRISFGSAAGFGVSIVIDSSSDRTRAGIGDTSDYRSAHQLEGFLSTDLYGASRVPRDRRRLDRVEPSGLSARYGAGADGGDDVLVLGYAYHDPRKSHS